LLVTATYDEATDFKNSIAIVTSGGKKGVVNSNGKLIIPCEMDEITFSGNSMLKLEKNEKLAWYNLALQKQVWSEEGF
jgi:hypothetical protein